MFGIKEGLDITTLTYTATREEADAVVELLAAQGIRAAVREDEAEQSMLIVSEGMGMPGFAVLINAADAEDASQILFDAGIFGETEELTDEELEELAMSMAEITGLEDEEEDENDRKVREWISR